MQSSGVSPSGVSPSGVSSSGVSSSGVSSSGVSSSDVSPSGVSSSDVDVHKKWMHYAINLAKKGKNKTAPNPNVGCVIVRHHTIADGGTIAHDGIIVGEGYHQKAGTPHAEIHALRQAQHKAKGATLYVTLEPCCIMGKTPPCTKAIIQAGITQVVCAMLDPNPKVHNKGVEELQIHGIHVIQGILKKEAMALNTHFIHFMRTQLPYVTLKWAMSLNGKQNPNENPHITNGASLRHSHQLREDHQAICVGAHTITHDNPSLNIRYLPHSVRQPIRIILDAKGSSPIHARVYETAHTQPTWMITTSLADTHFTHQLKKQGVKILMLPHNDKGKMDPKHILQALAKESILSILLEGGEETRNPWITHHCFQDVVIYIGNKFIIDDKSSAPMKVSLDHLSPLPYIHIKKILNLEQDVCILGSIATVV